MKEKVEMTVFHKGGLYNENQKLMQKVADYDGKPVYKYKINFQVHRNGRYGCFITMVRVPICSLKGNTCIFERFDWNENINELFLIKNYKLTAFDEKRDTDDARGFDSRKEEWLGDFKHYKSDFSEALAEHDVAIIKHNGFTVNPKKTILEEARAFEEAYKSQPAEYGCFNELHSFHSLVECNIDRMIKECNDWQCIELEAIHKTLMECVFYGLNISYRHMYFYTHKFHKMGWNTRVSAMMQEGKERSFKVKTKK